MGDHNQPEGALAPQERVQLNITRSVTITDATGRPALELEAKGDDVRVFPLPRNSGKRSPVNLADLARAVYELKR